MAPHASRSVTGRGRMNNLGKYEVRSVLGRGAMGTVYEGWDPVICRRVAIKTVGLPDSRDSEEQEKLGRFQQEARAAGGMQHPNIVGVFDYAETDELAYIVMEFVEGRTLKALIDDGIRLDRVRVAGLMDGLLTGLAYSHAHGVIHRDIKPANVIVTASGQVKIADFGIAHLQSSTMTQAGSMMGTPAYMSPEQFRGGPVSGRTDIYAAGIVLYQLLTGKRPFDGGMATIMHGVLNDPIPPPSVHDPAIPPALDAAVARATARAAEDRFPDAAAFAAALRAALPAPGAVPEIAAASVARQDADATIMVPAGPDPATPSPVRPPAHAPARTPAYRRLVLAAVGILAVTGGAVWALRDGDGPRADAAPCVRAGQPGAAQPGGTRYCRGSARLFGVGIPHQ